MRNGTTIRIIPPSLSGCTICTALNVVLITTSLVTFSVIAPQGEEERIKDVLVELFMMAEEVKIHVSARVFSIAAWGYPQPLDSKMRNLYLWRNGVREK